MMETILVTGATGYIGGRLLDRLIATRSNRIHCLTRRPETLLDKQSERVRVLEGDVQDPDSMLQSMQGVKTAYYLIHSMGDPGDFEEADRQAAENFAWAAKSAGVRRIIYVGALGDSTKKLSSHLRSRQEVGRILKNSDAQVLEFRASIVIGSGSLSFELVRSLVDRLPIMVVPKWARALAQPIYINDLLSYLEKAIDIDLKGNQIFEIGGEDQVSYRGIMENYAKQRGLRRVMIDVPVLTPKLSSLWLGLVTPIFARTGRKLIDSLRYPTTVRDSRAEEIFQVHPVSVDDAVGGAMKNEDQKYAQTRWADALSSSGPSKNFGGVRFGRRILDARSQNVNCTPEQAFRIIQRIGGEQGWKYGNWAWKARGLIDLFVGGVGLRRGRRHPTKLKMGDTVDWWRVEKVIPNELLLLRAEMKVPGRAWLKYEITPTNIEGTQTKITQTAIFDPLGVGGQIYWYALYPPHVFIFKGMLEALVVEMTDEGT